MRIASLSIVTLLALLALGPREARAGVFVGVDANASKLVGDGSDAFDLGYGGSVRGGYELPIPILTIQLGGLFRYNRWTLADPALNGTLTGTDFLVGGRAGVGAFLKPWAQFFIGYGHLSSEVMGQSASDSGTALLIGGGLDIALPVVSVGVHVDWNKDVIDTQGTQQSGGSWVAFGGNLTLSF